MKDERTYLTHAIEAIDAIADYTADGQKAFFSDGKTQDAVIRNIEVIGQAVKGISEDTRAPEPALENLRERLANDVTAEDKPPSS